MSITAFGFIWAIVAFFALIANRVDAMVVFTLFSMVLQCDIVLYFGGIGIGPQILASILFIVKSFAYASPKHRMHFDPRYLCALTLLLVLVSCSALNGVLGAVAINVAQLSIYIVCFIRFFSVAHLIGRDRILKYFRWLVIFVAIIGLIQFLIVLGIIPRLGIVSTLIYNDPNPNIYYNIERTPRLYSTFMEPSYCVPFLVGAFYFIMVSAENKTRADHALLIVLLVEIVATQSTTGYIAFIAVGAICIAVFKDRATARYLIPEMLILLVALLVTPDLLDTVIFSKAESGSAATRDVWNDRALTNFVENPVVGIGYKQSRASSLLFSLLAESGICGLISYCALIISCIVGYRTEDSAMMRCGKTLVLTVATCQFIAVPDVDFCVFWLCMYVYAAVAGANRRQSSVLNRDSLTARISCTPMLEGNISS